MRAVVNLCQQAFEPLRMLFSWIYHLAHLLKAPTSSEDAPSQLLTWVRPLQHRCPHEARVSLAASVEKMTGALTPPLLAYLKQPLGPRPHNALELFIGRIKKSRRHGTGRKNTPALMLREGSFVALLLGLPEATDWTEAVSRVNPDEFHHTLDLLRQTDTRKKGWHARRDLEAFLAALEQPWLPHEGVLQR